MNKYLPGRITKGGESYLGIPIGLARNDLALTRFTALNKTSSLRSSPGWIVKEDNVSEWTVDGFFKTGGKLFLYGPYHEGIFLEEILDFSPERALFYLLTLIQAIILLKKRGISYGKLQSDSVYFLNSGGILFLPPVVMKKVLETQPLDYKLHVFESLNNPDLTDGDEQLSYSLGVLLYRIICGDFPFEADTDEEIHQRIRSFKILSVSMVRPEVKEEVSEAIDRCLIHGQDQKSRLTLEEWSSSIQNWRKTGLFRNILESERENILQKGAKILKRSSKAYQRRIYWQKHWKIFTLCFIALLIVSGITGSMIKRLLAPRATHGFPPLKVVETFYNSINSLNHALMEDCVIKGAGKEIIKEVIQIYVTSRVSMGYEGKSHLLPADQWDQMGRPALEPPQSVYGITDLKIRETNRDPPTFIASYRKWVPAARDDPEQGSPAQSSGPDPPVAYKSFQITERLSLKADKEDWVIYKIERLELNP